MAGPRNHSQIRQNNLRSILTAVKQNGPVSKRELQTLTGLSWGAVSALTSDLVDNGYLVLTGKQITNIGRKPEELDINAEDKYIVGLDLNLSGICGVLADMKGRIVRKWVRPIAQNEYACVMDTVLSLLDTIHRDYADKQILGIGLAVQGIVDVANGVSVYLPEIRHWKDVPIRDIVAERFRVPVLLMHDPNCLMVAERACGSSWINAAENAILLRIDNGIGMSMMIGRQIYLGSTGKAGEFGHIPVDPSGPVCTCGNRGCLEEYASGNGLVRRYLEQVSAGAQTAADTADIRRRGYKLLAEAAQQGDALCVSLFAQMGRYLGLAIAAMLNVLNPDLVVLYGELTDSRRLFHEAMMQALENHVYGNIPAKLVYSELPSHAAAQGAALMVAESLIEALDLPNAVEAAAE